MIKKLDTETINLISAGEVIECPADILKELIENSIDACSKSITVTIKNSGLDLIEIKDDGLGISKQDLPLTTERHTTSKLNKIDDLYSLDTFGFRGEALSSISAVSKFKITSSDNETGVGYFFKDQEINEIPFSRGTTISVVDLFYNVSVRKKFLKSNSFEFTKVYNVFLEFVILNPDIKFQFISEKKNVVFPRTTREGRFIQIFGKDIISKTVSLDIKNELFSLTGILCKPTNYFYFPLSFLYINKRPVYSAQINKQVSDIYKDYLMIQQKPFFVLFFELDSNALDINIHPKKRSIKIHNEFVFLNQLKEELQNIFISKDKVLPNISPISSYVNSDPISSTSDLSSSSKEAPFTVNPSLFQGNDLSSFNEATNFEYVKDSSRNSSYLRDQNISIYLPNFQNKTSKLFLNNIEIQLIYGQILDTFIVCKTSKGLLLIDQHAAEERINLENNRKSYIDYLKVQTLLSLVKIQNLNLDTKAFIQDNLHLFSQLGFEIVIKAEGFYLKTIPEFLNRYFTIDIFYEILKNIEENPKDEIEKLKDKILKLKSCKESIKANDVLSLAQMSDLIKRLNDSKDNTICAHGRPTYLYFTKKDLEKMFKRII